MFGGLEMLVPATLTDVVFVFLCSKPVFAVAALGLGIVAHTQTNSERPQIPEQV